MDEFNEKDPLWNLMGKARKVEASPYFARKVLRAVQQEKQPHFFLSLVLRWLVPTTACAAAVLSWTVWQHKQEETAEFNAYFDTAADLQSLVAYEDSSVWVDTN